MPARDNPILDTDSYKSSHFLQYPEGTDGMFSYLESRGGRFPDTVFFGLQYLLDRYLSVPVTGDDVDEAADFFARHGEPFPWSGWLRVVDTFGGLVPLRIRAVPEGSRVPTGNVLMTVESTDPETFWLVTWLETKLMRVWYPTTVATVSRACKELIRESLVRTADNPAAEIGFKLHDFGARGVSSLESAAIGGAAHLVNFLGSDTVAGVVCANRYYDAKMAGFSIPAAEHSTITAWGRNGELDAYRNMLRRFAKPGALVACVSDSYDLYNAVDRLWGDELRQQVIDSGATVVIRPDSGEPPAVVRKTLQMLDTKFGHKVNSRGYRVLNHVRVIQGDGITVDSLPEILSAVTEAGYSASNIAFGMGGGLLQQVNRDTQKFAYKCSAVRVSGRWKPVSKAPVTDLGKASKAGRLDLVSADGRLQTIDRDNSTLVHLHGDSLTSRLETVYENGRVLRHQTFDDVRARAESGIMGA